MSTKWCLCYLGRSLAGHSFSSKEHVSFNFMAAVTIHSEFGAQENKICHCSYFFPFCLPWCHGTGCRDLNLFDVEFQASFFSPLSPSSRGCLVALHFLRLQWYHLHIWGCWYFSQKAFPGSSQFMYCWMNPTLKDFEYNFACMWNECNSTVLWTFFGIALLLGLEWKLTFSSPVSMAEFSKLSVAL